MPEITTFTKKKISTRKSFSNESGYFTQHHSNRMYYIQHTLTNSFRETPSVWSKTSLIDCNVGGTGVFSDTSCDEILFWKLDPKRISVGNVRTCHNLFFKKWGFRYHRPPSRKSWRDKPHFFYNFAGIPNQKHYTYLPF